MQPTPPPAPSGAAATDLQPPRLVVGALFRRWWVVVGVFLVVTLLALGVIGGDGDDGAEATARLGLTDEVVWPFYDAARDRVDLVVSSPALRESVEAAAGATIDDIRVEIPVNQAYVDLVVEADDVEVAEAARDAAVAEVIAGSVSSQQARLETDRATLADDFATREAELAALDALIADTIEEQGEINASLDETPGDPVLVTRNRQLDSQRSRAQTERNVVLRNAVDLADDLALVERRLESIQPEVEVLRLESTTSTASSPLPVALLLGLVAAAAAGLALLVADRERGIVRDPWYVRGPVGLPVLGTVERRPDGTYRGLTAAVDHLLDRLGARVRVVGLLGDAEIAGRRGVELLEVGLAEAELRSLPVLDAGPEDPTIDDLPDDGTLGLPPGLERVILPVAPRSTLLTAVHDALTKSDWLDVALVDLDGDYLSEDQLRLRTRMCDLVIVVVADGRSRVRTIRARTEAVRAAGGNVVGALLVDPDA